MKNKPNPVGPATQGPRPAKNRISGATKKQTSSPSSGANATEKDSTDVLDSLGTVKKEWQRKDRKSHADHKAAKVQGGSIQ